MKGVVSTDVVDRLDGLARLYTMNRSLDIRQGCHAQWGLNAAMTHDGLLILACKKCKAHVASFEVKNPPELKCDHPAHGKRVH